MRCLQAALVLFSVLLLSVPRADARARCGAYTTREYRAEIDPAPAIFVGVLISAQPRDDMPAGTSGVPGADVTFRVAEAIRGVAAGDTVQVYWQGFSEPPGLRAGGCRVPELGDEEIRMLVIAQGALGSLTVPNATTSQRVDGTNRRLVRRVRRIATGSHRRTASAAE